MKKVFDICISARYNQFRTGKGGRNYVNDWHHTQGGRSWEDRAAGGGAAGHGDPGGNRTGDPCGKPQDRSGEDGKLLYFLWRKRKSAAVLRKESV